MANLFRETHFPRYKEEGFAYLKTIPEVKRFLDAEIFEVIQLTRERILLEETGLTMLEFDVVAPDLIKSPGSKLIKSGLAKRHNLIRSRRRGLTARLGLPDNAMEEIPGEVRQVVGFFGSSLQIALNIRRQAATSDNSA